MNFFMLISSKWFLFALFIILIIVGMVIEKFEKKGKSEEESELDKTVASFSGMNEIPWREEQDNTKNTGVKHYYSKKTSRRANLKRIIWTEKNIMGERAKEAAKKEEKK